MNSDPIEDIGTSGFYVTDIYENAVDYARTSSGWRKQPQPGVVLEFNDADISNLLKGAGTKPNEAIISFDAFDKVRPGSIMKCPPRK